MIANTSKTPQTSWLFGGNPDAIESQEAQGQKELAQSSQLPARANYPRGANALEKYAELGIKVLEKNAANEDPLFLEVVLPDGWRIEPTEHSMWSHLVDAEDRIKAMIFYKAAFYDRDAFINFASE